MKIFSSLLLVLISSIGYSQSRVLLSTGDQAGYSFLLYGDNEIIKPALQQPKNSSIEELMSSILGADNQDWFNANILGGAKNAEQKTAKDFEQIKNRNKDKTFIQLISKLELKSSGQQFAIIKFKIFLEQFPNGISGAYQLQKVGNIWYKTVRTDLSDLGLMMIFFNPIKFQSILEKRPTTDKLMSELINKVYESDGQLNFQKLYTEFSKWETDKERKAYFLEPTGW